MTQHGINSNARRRIETPEQVAARVAKAERQFDRELAAAAKVREARKIAAAEAARAERAAGPTNAERVAAILARRPELAR